LSTDRTVAGHSRSGLWKPETGWTNSGRAIKLLAMLVVISPAKSLDYDSPVATKRSSVPDLLDHSAELIEIMRTKSPDEIADLMHISPSLAQLNFERYHDWTLPFTNRNARQAILAFNGDVYAGMAAPAMFSTRDYTQAQKVLRILSGLYGVLRPLDLIAPYRLEMGTKLRTAHGSTLVEFWGDTITDSLRSALDESPGRRTLVNLASQEYFSAVRPAHLDAPVVTPVFLDTNDAGTTRVVSFFAKRARGTMASWIIRERITNDRRLKEFDLDGYLYSEERSTPATPTFVR
jgi:cytoplasmic iron level regulating protein YaaA (DUF328/UPF0246 family)